MKREHKILFTPFKIGKLQLKNRIIMTAMTGTALINKGKFNSSVTEYYIERARGGVGLIISGCSVVYDMFGRDYWVNDAVDVFEGPIKTLMEQIHDAGAKFFMQIGAGLGRVANLEVGQKFAGADVNKVQFAPSQLPNVWNRQRIHREMDKEEIEKIIAAMIETAALAKSAGIDGVEIHAVHEGYLLDQFAIANTNHRKDEYGGSLENRLRFATEIIKGIKRECGADFPIMVRYGAVSKMKGFNSGALPGEDYVEFGRNLEESPAVARLLEKAGADALDADNGSYDSWYWAHPPVYMHKACNLPEAEYIKNFVRIPVICAGRMEDPDLSAKAIENDKIDAVGIARQFLAEPEYVEKIRKEDFENIRPCIACHNGCLGSLLAGEGVSCALRPATMREKEYELIPAEKKRNVMIVGGGISGMEAARVAKKRGHEVVIYEKSGRLGGAFTAAAAPAFKEADKKLIDWYKHQMEENQIPVVINNCVNEALIREVNPDVLINACGAFPRQVPIQGADSSHVIEVKELLLKGCCLDGKTVVVGGGLSGCEAAYQLALNGGCVRIIEMAEDILQGKFLSMANSSMLRDLMKRHDIEVLTSTRLRRILNGEIEIEQEHKIMKIPADHVVMATGYLPKETFFDRSEVKEVYTVGDAVKAGSLMDAIKDAYQIALKI